MTLSEDELKKIEDRISSMAILYNEVKSLIVESERMEEKQRLSISAINELRNAFDHLMRVVTAKSKNVNEEGLPVYEYCNVNIDKSYGHIYRAGYDAYDVISYYYIADIKRIIESVSYSSLVAGFNDYAKEVRIPFDHATKMCNLAKMEKDIGAIDTHKKHFAKYAEGIEDLKAVRERLETRWKEVMECEKERRRLIMIAGISLIISVTGITITLIITFAH